MRLMALVLEMEMEKRLAAALRLAQAGLAASDAERATDLDERGGVDADGLDYWVARLKRLGLERRLQASGLV